jgi:hypothetical protein
LLRGQVGTIVELLADGAAFEVEFSDSLRDSFASRNGQTYQSISLRPEQIIVLHFHDKGGVTQFSYSKLGIF